MKTILVVDDEIFIRENLKRILEKEGYEIQLAPTGAQGVSLLNPDETDMVLLDLNLPDMSGIEVLKKIKQVAPRVMVIIITGYATVDSAVEALKLGAYDYIKKPFKADAIKLIVRLALETQHLKKEVSVLKRMGRKNGAVIAESPGMKKAVQLARDVARHPDTGVLVTGESGTGKEVVARLIHESSARSEHAFVDINCSSVPEQLLESELFGYEKGAFTDARTGKQGLFEEAEGGTVFLDEIGEMPQALQAKLLRVIETKSFRKVGGSKNIFLDARIIAATNRDLKKAVEEKMFREDLFYRLNVFPIHLPPLRERKEDIIPLARHFLSHYARIFGKRFKDLDDDVGDLFLRYPWRGNVRELKNMLERICIMHDGELLSPDLLPAEIHDSCADLALPASLAGPGSPLSLTIADLEKRLITESLGKTGGNILKAAKLLGMPRGTLRHKMQKYGIKVA